jgi:hypothetical protein
MRAVQDWAAVSDRSGEVGKRHAIGFCPYRQPKSARAQAARLVKTTRERIAALMASLAADDANAFRRLFCERTREPD